MEDGADAAGRSSQDQDTTVPGLELQEAGQKGAKTGADLGYGPLFPRGAAAADGDGRGQDFDKGDAFSDIAALGVERLDHGVGAVAFRFRSDEKNQDPGDQPPHGGDEEIKPGAAGGQGGHQGGVGPLVGSRKPVGRCRKKYRAFLSSSSKRMAPQPDTRPTAMLNRGQRKCPAQPNRPVAARLVPWGVETSSDCAVASGKTVYPFSKSLYDKFRSL